MDNFDFKGLRLDHAFRRLCGKLYLKAETQQVDRILDQFSQRYWECNPGCLFGSASMSCLLQFSWRSLTNPCRRCPCGFILTSPTEHRSARCRLAVQDVAQPIHS
jgi:hypothetical protein